MQLSEAISLIQHPLPMQKSRWADLGCGKGLFTHALSQLLFKQSLIYAVDKNENALQFVSVKKGIELKKLPLDFLKEDLPLPLLSGILMANSFHFVKDKKAFFAKASGYLNETGYFIFVEYDTDTANPWVPYPIGYENLKRFFAQYNYSTEKIHAISSQYNRTIYSAIIYASQ